MTDEDPNRDLSERLEQLAEHTIDRLNRDAPDQSSPVILTSYVLIVEGNGYTPDGDPVTRSVSVPHGSSSQIKGLLVETLDDIRAQDRQ